MLRISSNSHCTPLPCKEKTLSRSSNKVQIIDVVFDFLSIRVTSEELFNTLVITGSSDVPVEVTHGHTIPRPDLRTTHEEADLIIVQQYYGLTFDAGCDEIYHTGCDSVCCFHGIGKKLLLR